MTTNEAANWLAGTVPQNNKTKADRVEPPTGQGTDTLKAFKAGYASTGLNRGRLALPLCDSKGNLVAYCGRSIKEESPKLIFPNGTKPEDFIFNANQVAEGELYSCAILWRYCEPLRAASEMPSVS